MVLKPLEMALDRALGVGASYADARSLQQADEGLTVRNGQVEQARSGMSYGLGVRVLVDGQWGFAAGSEVSEAEAARLADLAVEIARGSGAVRKREVRLAPAPPTVDTWESPCRIDPWSVPTARKVDLLREACKAAQSGGSDVRVTMAYMRAIREVKTFASTEGARIAQTSTITSAGVRAVAVGAGEMQVRSYPGTFDGNVRQAGYEFVEEMDLAANARRVGAEAQALLSAQQCPSGTMTLILGTNQLALQIHESCGHPTELDRVYGTEASFAGTSFLTTEKLDNYRYGSNLVNLYADSRIPGGLGTFAYDDEGTPACHSYLVKDGMFVGYLMSRETAHDLGTVSNGAMRASGWDRMPIIRMTNICLEPGGDTLESLIAGTDDGVFMDGIKSWSIDDRRLNFQFGSEIGYRIRNGQLAEMVKNPTYTGITPEFWGSCDGIAGSEEWVLWGVPNCGKGEPLQIMRVGHGTSPARFRNVKVGVGRW
ncbi:MAG: TldD/PmbA family protein [Firmicutes bacterium]|jgi:TldD protein|nr:TldD/PmbA family protein [Bacillota bacterium]